MYQDELKTGEIYSNGKKRESVRKIMGFPSCPHDLIARNCVRYLVLRGLRPEVGKEFTITLRSFMKWAHHRVNEENVRARIKGVRDD